MTPTTDLGLSIRLSMFELHETGDWDMFLGPPEQARAETGGTDQWVLKRREYYGVARVNQVTSACLRYPLSVFNKNSTLKRGNYGLVCLYVEPPQGGVVWRPSARPVETSALGWHGQTPTRQSW